MPVCCGVAITGLLVLSDLQAPGWPKGFSRAGCWTAEEAATRTNHTRQATHLRPLYQLLQVCKTAEPPWNSLILVNFIHLMLPDERARILIFCQ